MKRMIAIALISLVFPLFAAIAPNSESIGRVQLEIISSSSAEMVLKAFQSEYSEQWLADYANSDELFALAYSGTLSSLLPMANLVIGEEGEDSLSFYSLDSGDIVHVSLSDGYLIALSFERLSSQAGSEETQNTGMPYQQAQQ